MMSYRFKEWLLCALCFAYAPVRGRARGRTVPERVVIIQMAKLGDMVCTTPLFRALKNAYPAVHITVVGNALNEELLQGNTDIDTYMIFRGIYGTIRELRKNSYDFGCVVTPDAAAFAILYLAGARSIVAPAIEGGYSPYETAPYKLMRVLGMQAPHRFGSYAPREYLHLLGPVGVTSQDTTKHLAFSREDETAVEEALQRLGIQRGEMIIGMSPSSGNKTKYWPSERFAAVADHLIEKYKAKVLIIGTARDTAEIADMTGRIQNRASIYDAEGMFSIGSLKALMPRLALFVAVDTGPIYVAEAFGTPTVDIVGPMDEDEQPPRGEKHIVVVPPFPRVSQLHILDTRTYDAKEARRQSYSITADIVNDACDTLIRSMTEKQIRN